MRNVIEILNADETAREMLDAGVKVINKTARDKADAKAMREILVLMCVQFCPEAMAQMTKEG